MLIPICSIVQSLGIRLPRAVRTVTSVNILTLYALNAKPLFSVTHPALYAKLNAR